jgi:hypothetical protein
MDNQHPGSGEKKESTEDIGHPREPRDECGSRSNHHATHRQGTDHTPEQHPVLKCQR